jgi:prevent-host-death family protein
MQVAVKEAQKRRDDLIAAALDGEDVVITRYGKPVARVRQLTPDEHRDAAAKLAEKD